MVSPHEYIWDVPLHENYELIRKDYLAGWSYATYNLDPIAPANNPVYHGTSLCPIEIPVQWDLVHELKDIDLV